MCPPYIFTIYKHVSVVKIIYQRVLLAHLRKNWRVEKKDQLQDALYYTSICIDTYICTYSIAQRCLCSLQERSLSSR